MLFRSAHATKLSMGKEKKSHKKTRALNKTQTRRMNLGPSKIHSFHDPPPV